MSKRLAEAINRGEFREMLDAGEAVLRGPAVVPHVVSEGSRDHVVSWDTQGSHCSEPRCEVNQRIPKAREP